MPNENSTPVGTSQISQDNQAMTNQTGDDFVLDFGEPEDKGKIENSEVEHNLDGIEQKSEEEMISTDIDLNDINLFGEEEKQEDVQQDDIKIEDEKEEEGVENDDFNISLDDNLSQEKQEDGNITEQSFSLEPNEITEDENENNKEETEGFENDLKQENIESEEADLNNTNEEEIDSEASIITEQENNLEDKENDREENFDGGFLQDDNENETNDFDNVLKDDENDNIDGGEQTDYYGDNIRMNDESAESTDEPIAEDNQDTPLISDEFHEDEENMISNEGGDNGNISYLPEDNGNTDENNFLDEGENGKESDSEDYLGKTPKDESNENKEEIESLDGENEFSYDFQEDSNDDSENKLEIENENDMNLGKNKTEFEENPVDIDFGNAKNEENTENEESVTQPEIGDLLGSSTKDFSEESKDGIETKDSEFNRESNTQSDADTTTLDVDQNEKDTNLRDDSDNEGQNFTLDYQKKKGQENPENSISEISNETVEGKKEGQIQEESGITPGTKINETDLANLVNNSVITNISTENSDEKVQNLESQDTNSVQETSDGMQGQQIKSTLSLDQILDSELTNNPQFTDSSKAVPTNVSENGGGFGNKKMIGIIACVGLFVLAGIVAVLAFPSKNNNKNNVEDGDIQQIAEEYGVDPLHQAPSQPEYETTGQDISSSHPGNPTIQQDFPETEPEDEPETEWNTTIEEQDAGEPAPYTCEGDECLEETVMIKEEDEKLDIESIESEISNFKLQADGYYSKGDELQDKKLIRYAAQAISLCESYQEQIDNGEGTDEESFSSFKSKVKTIISKMEEYLGGKSDIQTYTKSNYDEEYDFPGKDEHKEYIYEINS